MGRGRGGVIGGAQLHGRYHPRPTLPIEGEGLLCGDFDLTVLKGSQLAPRVLLRTLPVATATHLLTENEATAHPPSEPVVVRCAGDSGDGMQLTGRRFTPPTAHAGNDLATC